MEWSNTVCRDTDIWVSPIYQYQRQ